MVAPKCIFSHFVHKRQKKCLGNPNLCIYVQGQFIIKNTKDHISKIEMVQRRAARWTISNFDRRASVTEMLDKLGWQTLEQRRADARLCLFYKIVYGLVAVPLPDHVQYNNRISRYCHSMTFRQVSTSTDFYKFSFFPLAIIQCNALPESIVSFQRLDAFKAAICKLQHSRP